MASTIGTARGRTHGSCRPWASSVTASLFWSTVCWGWEMVAVGLKATRKSTSLPLLMPPCTPPEWLLDVRGRPSGPGTNGSLCSLPRSSVPAKPLPISKPLEAGSDNIARPRSASSLSKTGAPRPAGTPRATHRTTPPRESWARLAASMASTMRAAASGSGQRVGVASTPARTTVLASTLALTACTDSTQATISTPASWANSLRATAPLATLPMVSRALARPPPCQARIPNLASYV